MKVYRTTRDITVDECPWLDEPIAQGRTFYQFLKPTYGVVNTLTGRAVSAEPDQYPFHELPHSALAEVLQ